jgi:hypothetical protein
MTVEDLNKLPLNQAALARLKAEGLPPDPRHAHLLTLAQFGLEDDHSEPADEQDPRRLTLAFFLTVGQQAFAVRYLEADIEPEDVLDQPLPQLADDVGAPRASSAFGLAPHHSPA